MFPPREMLDVVRRNGQRALIVRNLVTGELEAHEGHAVLVCTGGYGTVDYLSTNAVNSQCHGRWRAHKRGPVRQSVASTQSIRRAFRCGEHQSKLTLMSESFATMAVSGYRRSRVTSGARADSRGGSRLYLERKYTSFGNLVPRDVASRNAKQVCDEGRGVGESGLSCIWTSPMRSSGWASRDFVRSTETSSTCICASRTRTRTRSRCASTLQFTTQWASVGDYNLMSTIRVCMCSCEANFSDHGAIGSAQAP